VAPSSVPQAELPFEAVHELHFFISKKSNLYFEKVQEKKYFLRAIMNSVEVLESGGIFSAA